MHIIESGLVFESSSNTERSSLTFPGICVLPGGRWLASCRAAPTKIETRDQHVLLSAADDEGNTWSTPSAPFEPPRVDGKPGLFRSASLTCARVLSPHQLAPRPMLLLSFAADWHTSLCVEPYNIAAQCFLARGHRGASFDLPQHGTRVDEFGEAIVGLRNAFVAGRNRFETFLGDAKTVIDRCIELELATPHRIAVCGTSRAGYLALRLLACDERIAGAAAFAPVTDWRDLSEFAADRDRADVAALQLSKFADALAGKSIFMIIGNHDARVSTVSCCRFYLALSEANARRGADDSHFNFQVRDVAGHTSQDSWYRDGAAFLLDQLETKYFASRTQ